VPRTPWLAVGGPAGETTLILVPTINSRHWNACYLQLSVQRCQHPPPTGRALWWWGGSAWLRCAGRGGTEQCAAAPARWATSRAGARARRMHGSNRSHQSAAPFSSLINSSSTRVAVLATGPRRREFFLSGRRLPFGLNQVFRKTNRKTEGPQHFAFPEISRENRGSLVLHSGNSRVSLSLRAVWGKI